MKRKALTTGFLCAAVVCAGAVRAETSLDLWETHDIAEEAYTYAFPMIGNYKAMYEFNIDKASGQYKGLFNQVLSDARVFTPKDTTVIVPNSDTPYSMCQMDLRAEPIVFCVPDIDKNRYYSVQLVDMYTFNYGYGGSRTTGNKAGCYMVAGPNWKGEKPVGIDKLFRCETNFSLAIFRTQLFNPGDLENVKKVQSGYKAMQLSLFQKQPALPTTPEPNWPKFTMKAFKKEAFSYLNFLFQFCPAVPQEKALREKFSEIGIAPDNSFELDKLSLEQKLGIGLGIKSGYEKIEKEKKDLGKEVNGWRIMDLNGSRAGYNGNYLVRAAVALAGIYANDSSEVMYPMAYVDNKGAPLDASKYKYTISFAEGQLPPVNAFWSITMYDEKSQLLVENPINRYLINSPMMPNLTKDADGSLTVYVQKVSPGKEKESNWLPAPNGKFFLVLRLYWPKQAALDGSWVPPAVKRTE